MGKSLYSSGWVVVINGNQTTTLNGAKIFNAGIPLIINSEKKLATGANSLTLE
jgi:hypothetical protein